jgi:hypothetical protein
LYFFFIKPTSSKCTDSWVVGGTTNKKKGENEEVKKNEICFWSRFVADPVTDDEPNTNDIAAETMAVASCTMMPFTCVQHKSFRQQGQFVGRHNRRRLLVLRLERNL